MGLLFFWMTGCTLGALSGAPGGLAPTAALGLLAWRAPRRSRGLATLLFALCLGLDWGALRAPSPVPMGSPEGWLQTEGTVLRSQRVAHDRVRVHLGDVTLGGTRVDAPVSLRVPGSCPLAVGSRYRAWASLSAHGPPGAPRGFWGKGTRAPPTDGPCTSSGRSFPRIPLPGAEASGLLRALTLGDRSGLRSALRESFVDTGTMHLLAISGLHLGVVAWGLYRLLLLALCSLGRRAWPRDNPALAAAGALLGMWLLVASIETTDATLRAAWGVSFVLAGILSGRLVDGPRVLALAAAGVVTLDPTAPLGPSFQLSFAAVAAILGVLATTRSARALLDEPGQVSSPVLARIGKALVPAVAVNLAASIATAPIALAWFGQFAPIGPLVNLAATPWVTVVVVPLAFLWCALAALCPPLADLLTPLLSGALGLLLDGVEVWADVAGSAQTARWPLPSALCLSVGFVAALWGGRARALGASLLALGAAGLILSIVPPDGWRLTAIDVGHGDALLLQGPRGETALIDAGGHRRDPARARALARRRVIPALAALGVSHLDLLVITHGDLDHVGGADEVARRLPVSELWVSSCPQRRGVRRLARFVAARGGRIVRVEAGPPILWGDARLQVLWPPSGSTCARGENDRSLVLRLATPGGRALLTGDAGAKVETRLLRNGSEALGAHVLKVGHHGSGDATTTGLVEATGARVALISAPYGPRSRLPARGTLARLRDGGVTSWITGRDGSIVVHLTAGRAPRVETIRTP